MELGEMHNDDVGWIKLAQYLVHCQIVMSMIMHGMGRNVLTS
jgi:hypothetical protein